MSNKTKLIFPWLLSLFLLIACTFVTYKSGYGKALYLRYFTHESAKDLQEKEYHEPVYYSMDFPKYDVISPERSPLYQKVISVIGDSYVANNLEPISDTWHFKIAMQYDMTYYNFGINGNGIITDEADGDSVLTRYSVIPKESDYILIIGGKNDHRIQLPIIEFKKGLRQLCEELKSSYPKSLIVFFTPWDLPEDQDELPIKLREYSSAIVDVCNEYSIPVYDNFVNNVINVKSPIFRAEYMQSDIDISHLNNAGHDLFLTYAEDFLLSLQR